ncbi:VWA domain-containing protein [Kitasatospora purpeofusca]|uniref:VWA domain-containing protein n=1 Tax=Kitasatospora purpeofusca TaxID=67352 RepID=UPI0035E1B6CC
MSLFTRKPSTPPTDGLVNLVKSAGVSLAKHGLTAERAAVYLVLDHSGSMMPFYTDGSVQRLAEQALGLSANLDDDGAVPLIYFGSHVTEPQTVSIGQHQGIIDRTHRAVSWGSTNYAAAIEHIASEYRTAAWVRENPALVIFQTDGEPDSRPAAEQALRAASHLPIFWAFVGFGPSVAFLERLDDLEGRAVDNASFFHAPRPRQVSDADLYDGITREYATWLAAARQAGIAH